MDALSLGGLARGPVLRPGQTTVPGAGTRVQFSATNSGQSLICLSAASANTGDVYIGDVTVTNGSGAVPGIVLAPGESFPPIPCPDLSAWYADVDVNDDLVGWLVL